MTQTISHPVLEQLQHAGKITAGQAAWALANGGESGRRCVEVLVQHRTITAFDVVQAGAATLGLDSIELGDVNVDPVAASKITSDQARRWMVLPYAINNGALLVACRLTKIRDVDLKDDLVRITDMPVSFVAVDGADIMAKINAVYRADSSLAALAKTMSDSGDSGESDLESMSEAVEEDPLVRFVNELIKQAIRARASDIHLEPTSRGLKIRFRIDGVLHVQPIPSPDKSRTINRLKVMAAMDIGTSLRPLDGRLTVRMPDRKDGVADLRVSSLPTVWGEKIVMRILDNSQAEKSLGDLGFSEGNYLRYSSSFTKPHGMILATGPTGSGKSTTLYATINQIANDSINVVTVEDPVEYRIEGVNQVQVNAKQGRGFAVTLKAILRQDPDVILLGEIRDEETAEIAITAALTGHLVLSTLHTNDAPSAIARLGEMGVAPFLIGDAVDAVIAQRLMRRLCMSCREPYRPTEEQLAAFGVDDLSSGGPSTTFFTARTNGCQRCANTGYMGRIAAHEVMLVTPEIASAASQRAQAHEIAQLAVATGMRRLRDDAIDKAARGLTTLEEVLRTAV